MNVCRICLENCEINNLCNCKGSIGYYHKECFQKWLNTCEKNECEFCKKKFYDLKKIFVNIIGFVLYFILFCNLIVLLIMVLFVCLMFLRASGILMINMLDKSF
jgi:E3 ubiquitin-protein ligase DOA10